MKGEIRFICTTTAFYRKLMEIKGRGSEIHKIMCQHDSLLFELNDGSHISYNVNEANDSEWIIQSDRRYDWVAKNLMGLSEQPIVVEITKDYVHITLSH